MIDKMSSFDESIWELYGLRMNPFLTNPLLVKGGVLPISCFIGRHDELRRIQNIFASSGGSRILISGDVGVGKTTFANYARVNAISKGHFTHIREISVQKKWTPTMFLMETMAAIYSSIKLLGNRFPSPTSKSIVSRDTYKKLEDMFDISPIKKRTSVNMSLLGVGGNIEAYRGQPTQLTFTILTEMFTSLAEEITNNTHKDMIIHFNNLENLEENDLKTLLNDLRDLFQTPRVNFIFVGSLAVHDIINSLPRLYSIFSDTPFILKSLSKKEADEIIEKRLIALRIKGLRLIKPYTPQALAILYKLYEGNIRNILNSFATAIMEINIAPITVKENPPILDNKTISVILKNVVEKRYLSRLNDTDRKVLLEAAKRDEFTNSELSKATGIKPQNISKYISNLSDCGCVRLKRVEGRNYYYTVEHQIKWIRLPDK